MNNSTKKNEPETINLIDFFRIFIIQKKIFLITTFALTIVSLIYALNRDESVSFTSTSMLKIGTYDGTNIIDSQHLQEDIFYIYGIDIKIVMRDYLDIVIEKNDPIEGEKLNERIVDYIIQLSDQKAEKLIRIDQIKIEESEAILDILQNKLKINKLNMSDEFQSLLALSNLELSILNAEQKIRSFERTIKSYQPTKALEKNKTIRNIKNQASFQQVVFTGFLLGIALSMIFSIGLYRQKNNYLN